MPWRGLEGAVEGLRGVPYRAPWRALDGALQGLGGGLAKHASPASSFSLVVCWLLFKKSCTGFFFRCAVRKGMGLDSQ